MCKRKLSGFNLPRKELNFRGRVIFGVHKAGLPARLGLGSVVGKRNIIQIIYNRSDVYKTGFLQNLLDGGNDGFGKKFGVNFLFGKAYEQVIVLVWQIGNKAPASAGSQKLFGDLAGLFGGGAGTENRDCAEITAVKVWNKVGQLLVAYRGTVEQVVQHIVHNNHALVRSAVVQLGDGAFDPPKLGGRFLSVG